ncbi:TPA: hypothetical protein ACO36R_002872, partial [Salmonella enterica subsp. enterica serovar Strathcona]
LLILFCKESLCVALNLSDILVHGVFANEKPQARQNTNVHLSIFILIHLIISHPQILYSLDFYYFKKNS